MSNGFGNAAGGGPAVLHSNDASNYFGDAAQVRALNQSQGFPGGFGGAQFQHYRASSLGHDGAVQRRFIGQRGGPAGASGDHPPGQYNLNLGRQTPPHT